MQKINVVDLDGTLLPYDSFRRLAKSQLKKMNGYLWITTMLRVLRIISGYRYKKLCTQYWKRKFSILFFERYAKSLYDDIDREVLQTVHSKTDANTTNIILSASPDCYVKKIILLLGWQGSGSYFEGQNFIHLYGQEKIKWLQSHYPQHTFTYHFAISDSPSDDALRALFKESLLWKGMK
jgi:phosphoserine phosphatase